MDSFHRCSIKEEQKGQNQINSIQMRIKISSNSKVLEGSPLSSAKKNHRQVENILSNIKKRKGQLEQKSNMFSEESARIQ